MQEGWKATGRIELLWKRLDPPKRDTLADLTGIQPGTLSGYNTGRLGLGPDNARKILDAMRRVGHTVSLSDLKVQPEEDPDLREEVAELTDLVREQFRLLQADLAAVEARLSALEAPRPDQEQGANS